MDYKQAADIELWHRCQQDDMRAYNELFNRYFPRMLHLTCRYIADTMKAEELCMDQLYRLWIKRHEIAITHNLSGYLFRSIRNLVTSHLRERVPVSAGLDELKEKHPLGRSADYGLLSEEADEAYRNALGELSPQRRRVFILSREENLTYAEIAQRMDLSVNTVENYMVAALGSLRKNIREYAPSSVVILLFIFC